MKKVLSFLTISFLLCLCSCDFLRRVAGRPDSARLEVLSAKVAADKALKESLAREAAAREAVRKDSLAAMPAVLERNLIIRDFFTSGEPLTSMPARYNLIVGVYRTKKVSGEHFRRAENAGFEPFFVEFGDGLRALCLASDDSLQEIVDSYDAALESKACPVNSWIYVRK